MQVHLLFTVKVAAVNQPTVQSSEHLAFVRYYTEQTGSARQQNKNLMLLHLKWEVVSSTKGKKTHSIPSYGVIDASSIVKVVCICRHFTKWKQGPAKHFLVNDVKCRMM